MSVTDEEAQILADGHILEKLYDIKTPEFLGRTILLATGSVLMAFALDFMFMIYWYVVYYALVTLSIAGISKLAVSPQPRLFQTIIAVEALSTLAYLSAPIYLWSQPELVMKFVGTAMMLGAILNSFTIRSNVRAVAAIDMVSNAAMILFVGTQFIAPPEMGLARFLGLAIATMMVGYYAIVLHDIFSLRRKNAHVTARSVEAEKMAAVGRLTGGIAHDFNNILTVVLGNLELSREVPDRQERDNLLDDAQSAAKRASLLTAQLLAFSRRSPLQAQALECEQVFDAFAATMKRDLAGDVTLTVERAPDAHTVFADPSQLTTALRNLIENAQDAMDEGGEILIALRPITLSHRNYLLSKPLPPGDYIEIQISDTGKGVDLEIEERIFEPFFTTKPVGKGSGLGLSMVKGFAAQSGGVLQLINSAPGATTFSLILPAMLMPSSVASAPREDMQSAHIGYSR